MTILSFMVGLSRDLHCHQGRHLVGHCLLLFKQLFSPVFLFLLSCFTLSTVQLQSGGGQEGSCWCQEVNHLRCHHLIVLSPSVSHVGDESADV